METLAAPATSTPTPKSPDRSRPRLRVIIALLAFTFAGANISNLYNSKERLAESFSVFDARLDNLDKTIPVQEQRIEALEEKVKKQEAIKPTQAAATAAVNTKDSERITALEQQLATLKTVPAAHNNPDLLATIKLLSAYHRLSEKILMGKPYAAELSALQDLSGANENVSKILAALAPYADNGVPTASDLLDSFDTVQAQQLAAESTPPVGATTWERFVFNLTHLVQIRRMDTTADDKSVDAILARAEMHLEREEVEAAIAEIKSLPEATQAMFTGWLEDAHMDIDVVSLLANLEEGVMTQAFKPATETPPTK